MFKKRTASVTLLFIFLCIITFLSFMHVTDADKQAYEALKEGKALFKDDLLASAGLLTQTRHNLRRDVLAVRHTQRLHAIQYSTEAKMTFDKARNELVEHLHDVRCVFQERLDGPDLQSICEIKADDAIYHYQQQHFSADTVTFQRYQAPGSLLPQQTETKNVLMDGIADRAEVYVGSELRLEAANFKGQFIEDGSEGQLSCQHMTYSPDHLHMEGDVAIAYAGIQGALTSQMLDLFFETPHSNKTSISEMIAQDAVHVQYGPDWIAMGDVGVYVRTPEGKGYNGILELAATRPQGTCEVIHANGSRVQASNITFDMQSDILTLKQATGQLITTSHSETPVDFSADEVVWDRAKDNLQLIGQVNLAENNTRWLRCSGRCDVDLALKHITIASIDSQVFVHDSTGDLRADKIALNYKTDGDKINADRIDAFGNVRLRRLGASDASSSSTQYAMADTLEYHPQTSDLTLGATKPHRVIFLDKAYDMKISAPGVSVKRNAKTLKDEVKGLGDVRLSFADQEIVQLEELFKAEAFQ